MNRFAPPRRPAAAEIDDHLDDVEIVVWRGVRIDVSFAYDTLTELGWKVDTEDSNLMVAFSRTWRAQGVKVWLRLARFVCAPPDGEVEAVDAVRFYRFDPARMPATTIAERFPPPPPADASRDERRRWEQHREDWAWLIENGDAQTHTFDLLTPVALGEVPRGVREEAWLEIEEALVLAED